MSQAGGGATAVTSVSSSGARSHRTRRYSCLAVKAVAVGRPPSETPSSSLFKCPERQAEPPDHAAPTTGDEGLCEDSMDNHSLALH
ncbi:hypothetical protein AOLI_G00028530 [Acnodon oligacanthus]